MADAPNNTALIDLVSPNLDVIRTLIDTAIDADERQREAEKSAPRRARPYRRLFSSKNGGGRWRTLKQPLSAPPPGSPLGGAGRLRDAS